MKPLITLLLLIFIACSNETKVDKVTNHGIDQSATEMWADFIQANPELKDEVMPEVDFFHTNQEDADRLADLTRKAKKRATSGLLSLYKLYKVDLPKVGAKQIVTDFNGKAKAIIENTNVDTIPFNEISKTYAEMDMGTDIRPLEQWKKAHWNFFETFLQEIGKQPSDEMLIVCTRFKVIWPKKQQYKGVF